MKRISLKISDELYEFAKGRAEYFGYSDAAAYLGALLVTTQLSLERGNDREPLMFLPDKPCSDERRFLVEMVEPDLEPRFIEDPGGGVWHESNYPGDLDDDIPF